MEMLSERGRSYADAELAKRRTEMVIPGDSGDPDTGPRWQLRKIRNSERSGRS